MPYNFCNLRTDNNPDYIFATSERAISCRAFTPLRLFLYPSIFLSQRSFSISRGTRVLQISRSLSGPYPLNATPTRRVDEENQRGSFDSLGKPGRFACNDFPLTKSPRNGSDTLAVSSRLSHEQHTHRNMYLYRNVCWGRTRGGETQETTYVRTSNVELEIMAKRIDSVPLLFASCVTKIT